MTSHAPASTSTAAVTKPNTGFENTPLHLTVTHAAHTATGSSGGTILRTLVALVIVIAVIYALTWVVRKVKGTGTLTKSSGDGLERVATLALAANRSVELIRVGSELHLIGVAETGVTGIRRFSEDEAVELGLPIVPPGATNAPRARYVEEEPSAAALTRPGLSLDNLRRLTQR